MGDHTEVVRVVYDPDMITYKKLLSVFWSHHDTSSQAYKRQYWNAVFYENERQEELAKKSMAQIRNDRRGSLETKILPVRSFTRAEQYHQKYHLQQNEKMLSYLNDQFPSTPDMLDSEIATRANAYLAGTINEKQLRNLLDHPLQSSLPESVREQAKSMMCGVGK